MEENKKKYDTPKVELIEARVEKGFQGSGDPTALRGYNLTEGQESKFS